MCASVHVIPHIFVQHFFSIIIIKLFFLDLQLVKCLVHGIAEEASMKMEKYGCGTGSLLMIILVAALLLSLPLLMGPLQPPPASILLIIFAVLFVAILISLHQASNWCIAIFFQCWDLSFVIYIFLFSVDEGACTLHLEIVKFFFLVFCLLLTLMFYHWLLLGVIIGIRMSGLEDIDIRLYKLTLTY